MLGKLYVFFSGKWYSEHCVLVPGRFSLLLPINNLVFKYNTKRIKLMLINLHRN